MKTSTKVWIGFYVLLGLAALTFCVIGPDRLTDFTVFTLSVVATSALYYQDRYEALKAQMEEDDENA